MPEPKRSSQVDDAVERVRDLNEQVLQFGRTAGESYLDAYETTLKTVADYQDKVADATQVEWIASIARAQAEFTREVARVNTSAARELLK